MGQLWNVFLECGELVGMPGADRDYDPGIVRRSIEHEVLIRREGVQARHAFVPSLSPYDCPRPSQQ
jgi:hypothetical protein